MEENNHVEDPVSAVISEENIVYFDDLLKATVDTFFREGVSLSHHLFDFPNFANHTAPIETPKESQVPRQFDKHEFPSDLSHGHIIVMRAAQNHNKRDKLAPKSLYA